MSQSIVGKSHRAVVEHELAAAVAGALTTDGWTSGSTEIYLAVTAHFINSEKEMTKSRTPNIPRV